MADLAEVLEQKAGFIERLLKQLEHEGKQEAVFLMASWMGNDRLGEMVEFLEGEERRNG